jgi:hypothetical protein
MTQLRSYAPLVSVSQALARTSLGRNWLAKELTTHFSFLGVATLMPEIPS